MCQKYAFKATTAADLFFLLSLTQKENFSKSFEEFLAWEEK
jgi:hypothetical protein